MKSNKGFTVIEVIVTIVILASLMAVAIPVVTGYFDDVKKQEIISETKAVVNVAETCIRSNRSSLNGTYMEEGQSTEGKVSITSPLELENIVKKANGHGTIDILSYKDDKVIEIKYVIDDETVVYDGKEYSVFGENK